MQVTDERSEIVEENKILQEKIKALEEKLHTKTGNLYVWICLNKNIRGRENSEGRFGYKIRRIRRFDVPSKTWFKTSIRWCETISVPCNKNAASIPIQVTFFIPTIESYGISKWDKIYEPTNIVENVLKDDTTVYKTINPTIDLTLSNGQYCFIAYVTLFMGDPGPGSIEVSIHSLILWLNLGVCIKCKWEMDFCERLSVHDWERTNIFASRRTNCKVFESSMHK